MRHHPWQNKMVLKHLISIVIPFNFHLPFQIHLFTILITSKQTANHFYYCHILPKWILNGTLWNHLFRNGKKIDIYCNISNNKTICFPFIFSTNLFGNKW
jgi:hypothetical protein